MSMCKPIAAAVLAVAFGAAAQAQQSATPGIGAAAAGAPSLGQSISEADIKAWDIDALPDGSNLPPGSGTAAQGAPIYAQKCAMCHGDNGVNPKPGYSPMVGLKEFKTIDAPKTVTYYEHATTIFDITKRAMPFQMPRTLTDNEVYALTAYILSLNKLIGETDVMNKDTLPKVKMPNAGKFIIRFPERI
jgi:mono/diheme cytochrome c family protein